MHLDKLRGVANADSTLSAVVASGQRLPQTGFVADQNQMQLGVHPGNLQRGWHDDIGSMVASHGIKRDGHSTRHG